MKWQIIKAKFLFDTPVWLAITPRKMIGHPPYYRFSSFEDVMIAAPWEVFKTK